MTRDNRADAIRITGNEVEGYGAYVPLRLLTDKLLRTPSHSDLKYQRLLGRTEGERVLWSSRVCCSFGGFFICSGMAAGADPSNIMAWIFTFASGFVSAFAGLAWWKTQEPTEVTAETPGHMFR